MPLMSACSGRPYSGYRIPEERCSKTDLENFYVKRRDAEAKHRMIWKETSDCFNRWEDRAAKHESLMSDDKVKASVQAYSKTQEIMDKKSIQLLARQEKLRHLLQGEEVGYKAEMTAKRRADPEIRRYVNAEMQWRRERELKREVELKERLQWRMNHPEIRAFESQLQYEDVKKSWFDEALVKYKERQNEYEQRKVESLKMAEERKKDEERERNDIENKQEVLKKWKKDLEQQVTELRHHESVTEALKLQQESILAEKWKVEEMLEEKKRQEEKLKKGQGLTRIWKHQTIMKMKQKAKAIEEELNMDQDLISKLLQREEQLKGEERERRKEARAEMQRVLNTLAKQVILEKERLKQVEFMFQEEAEEVWRRRELEWEAEKQCRERLLQNVVGDLTKQIDGKLVAAQRAREESLKQREDLLKRIEEGNEDIKVEEKELDQRQKQWREVIDSQVENRKQKKEHELLLIDMEEEELKRRVVEEERKLQEEMKMMRQRHELGKRIVW